MKVGVYCKKHNRDDSRYVQILFDILHEESISTYIYAPYYEEIGNTVSFASDLGFFHNHVDLKEKGLDFLITLGGDGTILSAITLVRDSNIPIVGINLGRLGFLASIEKRTIIQAILKLKSKAYRIEERVLLEVQSEKGQFLDFPYALNDFTVTKRDTSSMIIVHTELNGKFLNSYWGDGLLLSTPTGSTGYNLSCGGPIVFPNSGNFILTPIAPHNLNIRPIVISDNSVITFQVEGRGNSFLSTLDSRYKKITNNDKMTLKKANFTIKLVKPDDINFMKTLREKLTWGKDIRNH